jgi:hypothetical protein
VSRGRERAGEGGAGELAAPVGVEIQNDTSEVFDSRGQRRRTRPIDDRNEVEEPFQNRIGEPRRSRYWARRLV